jgi:hypothetical protein
MRVVCPRHLQLGRSDKQRPQMRTFPVWTSSLRISFSLYLMRIGGVDRAERKRPSVVFIRTHMRQNGRGYWEQWRTRGTSRRASNVLRRNRSVSSGSLQCTILSSHWRYGVKLTERDYLDMEEFLLLDFAPIYSVFLQVFRFINIYFGHHKQIGILGQSFDINTSPISASTIIPTCPPI